MSLLVKFTTHLNMLGYDADDTQKNAEKIIRYLDLIKKWNRVYNLTSICKPEEMLSSHILDSLAVVPHLNGHRLADVGSGAGLPGIPIAIFRPHWKIVLIESSLKKSAFLQQVKFDLELDNINVIRGRVEKFHPPEKFNTVICRALCSLRNFVLLAGHLLGECNKENRLVVMKGARPENELKQLPENFFAESVFPIIVPGLSAKRHLVLINKKDDNYCGS